MQTLLIIHWAEEGFQHAGKLFRLRPVAWLSRLRVVDVRKAICWRVAVLLLICLQQMIRAVPLVRVQGFHQRVREHLQVAGTHPHLARQNHRRIKANHIRPRRDHGTPPLLLDVLLQLHTERAVVPGRTGAAIDLTTGVDQTTPFTQVHHGLNHGLVSHET